MRIFAARYICSREYFPSEQTSGMLCRAMAVRLACVWHVCANLMGFRGTIFCSAIWLVKRMQLRNYVLTCTDLPSISFLIPYTLYLMPILCFAIWYNRIHTYVRASTLCPYVHTYVRTYVCICLSRDLIIDHHHFVKC